MSYYGLDALLVSSRARAAHAYRKRRHHLSGSYGARECHVGVFPATVGARNVEPAVPKCVHPRTGPPAVHGAAGPVVGGLKVAYKR